MRIDQSGTSDEAIPQTNPVVIEVGRAEQIVIAFAGTDGLLRTVTITDGIVGNEEPLSMTEVLQNADVVTNDGAVAHLVAPPD